jgi:hypothetical protein
MRTMRNEKLNSTRVEKHLKPGDIVFCVDNSQVPGSSRPLRTKLSPSPFVVIRPLFTTTIVKRIADGFTTTFSNEILKVYNKSSPEFSSLPREVSAILVHKFSDLLESDIETLCRLDPLEIPNGIQAFNADTEHEDIHRDSDSESDNNDENDNGSKIKDSAGKGKGKGKNRQFPQPSTSQTIDESSSSSDEDEEDEEDVLVLRNKKKIKRVRFQD